MCFDDELKEAKANVQKRKRSRKMVIFPIAHAFNYSGARNDTLNIVEYQYSIALTTMVVNILNMKNVCKALILDFSYLDSYKASMRAKVQAVNSYNPKLAIEIHLNSSRNPLAKGFETLYVSERGKKFGEMIHASMGLLLGPDRGLKRRDDLFFLNATTCPALILEPLFLSNSAEALKLKEEKFLEALAESISMGVKQIIES